MNKKDIIKKLSMKEHNLELDIPRVVQKAQAKKDGLK